MSTVSPIHNGWRYAPADSRLDVYYRGTRVADFTATTFNLVAGGLAVATGGITITAGGLNVVAGTSEINDNVLFTFGADNDQVLVNRSTTLAANTALTSVLVGTPVSAATPANSLLISNVTADGDIALFTRNAAGANSIEMLRLDASAGLTVFNEASDDMDFRVEAGGIAYAIYSDGGKDALVLGSNTDTSSADQLITVSRAARTATAATNYFDLAMAPAGAVTVPTGTTTVVAEVSIAEPNITATGTVTNATTLYIASQPTEGGTTNSAIFFGAAANIAGTTSLTINEDSADLDFRVETNGLAYALALDGGKDAIVLGSNTDTSSADQLITVSRAARTATASTNYFDLAMAPAGAVTVPTGTTTVVAEVSIAEPNITATGTVTNATTLYIASQPTEGGTTNSSIFFGAAANIAGTTSITFNEDSADVDFRIESNDNANAFVIDAGANLIGLLGAVVAGSLLAIAPPATSLAAADAAGRILNFPAVTITDSTTAMSGTATANVMIGIARPTLAATNTSVTTTDAATLYIANDVAAGTNQTLTRSYALWVDAGQARFDANIQLANTSLFATTQPTEAMIFDGNGTAPSGAITTSSAIYASTTVMRKILASGTDSAIEA